MKLVHLCIHLDCRHPFSGGLVLIQINARLTSRWHLLAPMRLRDGMAGKIGLAPAVLRQLQTLGSLLKRELFPESLGLTESAEKPSPW